MDLSLSVSSAFHPHRAHFHFRTLDINMWKYTINDSPTILCWSVSFDMNFTNSKCGVGKYSTQSCRYSHNFIYSMSVFFYISQESLFLLFVMLKIPLPLLYLVFSIARHASTHNCIKLVLKIFWVKCSKFVGVLWWVIVWIFSKYTIL